MKTAIIIPARYASSRFPGKPLVLVAGVSTLERVWRIAKSVRHRAKVIIATDDELIMRHVDSFGGEAVMTSKTCANGTERVFEAINAMNLKADIILNFQGDAVLTPPWVLDATIEELERDPRAEIVTPAVELDSNSFGDLVQHKAKSVASGTTVVFDVNRNALYFSKAVIPFTRNSGFTAVYRHIGLYGFRRESLSRFVALPPSPLELTEGLEQLRALEHGIKIRIVIVDYRGCGHGSIDAPEDVQAVESIIKSQGELLDLAY